MVDPQDQEWLDADRREEQVDDTYEDWVQATFCCPECGAQRGQPCSLVEKDLELHSGADARTMPAGRSWGKCSSTGVSRSGPLSGGAFEMNRTRH